MNHQVSTAHDPHTLAMHDPANVTNPEHHEHHIVGPTTYLAILGVLLLGTGLTVGAALLPGVPEWANAPIALAIAVTKAVFVVLFFMHVKYSTKLTKLTVFAGFFAFFTLVVMSLLDYISRAWGQW